METPTAITWSHWPPRSRPRQAILLVFILFFLSSLVVYGLGWSWQSGLLITALVFSLRDFLFARSVLINREGLTVSNPLTGAHLRPWAELPPLRREKEGLEVDMRRGPCLTLGLPEEEMIDLLDDWLKWQAAGAVDVPADEPPPLTRQ